MRAVLCIALSLAASAACAAEPVTLVPQASVREFEGFKFPRLEFNDAEQRITYEPPIGWRHSSVSKHEVKLYPPNIAQADASIISGAAPRSVVEREEKVSRLRFEAVALLPKEAQNAYLIAVEENPIRVSGVDTCELLAEYTFFGQKFRMSVLSAEVGDSRLLFRFTAYPKDFDGLHQRFRASLATWQIVATKTQQTPSVPSFLSRMPVLRPTAGS